MKTISEMNEVELRAVGRLGLALEASAKASAWGDAARQDRDDAIVALRQQGWTIAETAEIAEISEASVSTICKAAGLVSNRGRRGGLAAAAS